MKTILLLFPTIDKLVRFRTAVEPKIFETNLTAKTLWCCCNEDEVELAAYVYGASVLEVQTSQN